MIFKLQVKRVFHCRRCCKHTVKPGSKQGHCSSRRDSSAVSGLSPASRGTASPVSARTAVARNVALRSQSVAPEAGLSVHGKHES